MADDLGRELSIFVVAKSTTEVWEHARRLMVANTGPIYLLLHSRSHRSLEVENASGLSGHQLIIGDETADLGSEPGAPDHKIGGVPYYHHGYDATIIEDTRRAVEAGFSHALQLSLPGFKDAQVRGNWPFGEFVFHIFAKPIDGDWKFLYGWA